MKTYLVELYLPHAGSDTFVLASARAREAGDALAREGIRVRYVLSIFIPGDDTCFHVFEGPSAEAVAEASRRAQLDYDRIVEAVQ